MPKTAPALKVSLEDARRSWYRKQGLAAQTDGGPAEVVASTGWPRTLGGVDVYLAVRARIPGMKRADLDAAVAAGKLRVLPAVRGCMYLVPTAQTGVLLRFAEDQFRKRADRELERAGVSRKEVEQLSAAVLSVLGKQPMTPDQIRKALPEGTIRNLGDKGKKIGLSSPLPTVLRFLELEGKVERIPESGRLDAERYVWRIPKKSPFAQAKVPSAPTARNAFVLDALLRFASPISTADAAAWSGLSQRDVVAAFEELPVARVAVEGYADETWVFEDELPALGAKGRAPSAPALLPFEDNFVVLHGGPGRLTDARHHGIGIPVWGSTKGTTIGDARHVSSRPLLLGDRLAGFWEFDPKAARVVFATFEPPTATQKKAIQALAEDQSRFLREDMGHAKSYSLDTEVEMKQRVAWLNTL